MGIGREIALVAARAAVEIEQSGFAAVAKKNTFTSLEQLIALLERFSQNGNGDQDLAAIFFDTFNAIGAPVSTIEELKIVVEAKLVLLKTLRHLDTAASQAKDLAESLKNAVEVCLTTSAAGAKKRQIA